ncbi:hypothetical protein FGE12_14935 [Aggregicoccus sp. 17bor-14]|uniref:hypothetical protein n=1 Tax=Myxococcaceae TaxID=31 RepID=UPI00129CE3F8|nr:MULTISPECIES: hypothetical protein [Myxococcaceae]MBF5043690.1 hypothetical protein [Simulacricoccus sp. 17bor-14]MRI89446.1 hypothetical protein [Aggregicoccus sp. 17bor-14]
MRELALVVAIALGLLGLGVLAQLPFDAALHWGALLTAGGLALGVPTGIAYHVQLARVLSRRGALPAGWYWSPIALHPRLRPAERPGVLLWCGAGAVGFAVTALGLAVMGVPTLLLLVQLSRGA